MKAPRRSYQSKHLISPLREVGEEHYHYCLFCCRSYWCADGHPFLRLGSRCCRYCAYWNMGQAMRLKAFRY